MEQFKDSFANAYTYTALLSKTESALKNPLENHKIRQELSTLLIKKTDRKVSERIVKQLISFSKENVAEE